MMHRCPTCNAAMKPLIFSWYCPNDCDLKMREEKAPVFEPGDKVRVVSRSAAGNKTWYEIGQEFFFVRFGSTPDQDGVCIYNAEVASSIEDALAGHWKGPIHTDDFEIVEKYVAKVASVLSKPLIFVPKFATGQGVSQIMRRQLDGAPFYTQTRNVRIFAIYVGMKDCLVNWQIAMGYSFQISYMPNVHILYGVVDHTGTRECAFEEDLT